LLDLIGFDHGVDRLNINDFDYASFCKDKVIAVNANLKAEPLEQDT
jgi:hypothetical protein